MSTADAATAFSPTSAAAAAGAALPLAAAALALIVRQEPGRSRRALVAATTGLGLVVGAAVHVALAAALAFLGLDARATPDDLVVLAFGFLLAAPLEQGALAAATLPALRSDHNDGELPALRFVLATTLGMLVAKAGVLGASRPFDLLLGARIWTMLVGEAALACLWGFVLAVTRRRSLGGTGFGAAWLTAAVFTAALDHLLFLRGDAALVAALPLATFTASVALFVARGVARRARAAPARRRRFLRSEAPSIAALRAALRRSQRPVLLGWIGFGALVTVGVVTTSFAAAIALGHRLGVDLAAVDRGRTGLETAPPIVLLGLGVLGGFPVAGYLVARASRSATVLEPAVAAGIAIVALAVLLGAAAPVALVFALAGAPIAFALACVGAWLGLHPS
jgi:hypothetical protein